MTALSRAPADLPGAWIAIVHGEKMEQNNAQALPILELLFGVHYVYAQIGYTDPIYSITSSLIARLTSYSATMGVAYCFVKNRPATARSFRAWHLPLLALFRILNEQPAAA